MTWAADALNRVDRDAFFARFQETDAVRYFYEPFFQAFDPELRRQLGVWYTPREIVRYMVERVDRVLRTELGIADGLADEQVWVLDPCCGTGAYLVVAAAESSALLGAQTHDIFLNADSCWRNIPDTVWRFAIGGYLVLKKFLSYRERPLLGRALTANEVRHVRDVARRLAALRLMAPELDANYRACATAHRPLDAAVTTRRG